MLGLGIDDSPDKNKKVHGSRRRQLEYCGGSVIDPGVPFEYKSNILLGDIIHLRFTIYSAEGFSFSLHCLNAVSGEDTVMQLRCRVNEPIIRNTQIAGRWGPEEKFGGDCSVEKDNRSEIIILVDAECYKISVNASHYADYRHRLLPSAVNKFFLVGSVLLHSFGIQSIESSNLMKVLIPESKGPDSSNLIQHDFVDPPFSIENFEFVKPGTVFYMALLPDKIFRKFTINFECGNNIALHFDARFDEGRVVLNHMFLHSWGKEISIKSSFRRGIHTDLQFYISHEGFWISVNNQHMLTYPHHIKDVSKIKKFSIFGDVYLVCLKIYND